MDYEDITLIKDRAEKNLHALSKTILDGLKPPAGPYGFFHHSAHFVERLQDCQRIVRRLFAGFGRRQAASRWGGLLSIRTSRQGRIVQKRFALCSVIATF